MTTGESRGSSDYVWVRVTTTDNVPVREGRSVQIGSHEIAIFNLGPSTALGAGDRFLATDNRCPHQGGPLCDGIVTGDSVVCPLHAWKVNLANGCVDRPASGKDHCVTTYPTRIDGGIVIVGVPVSAAQPRGSRSAEARSAEASASASAEGAAA